jgi:uncharacterized protein with HEPN domain
MESGYEGFLENRIMQNVAMRSFEVVGDAVRRVSPEFHEVHPDVPWRLMGDFRNKLRASRGNAARDQRRRGP